MNHMWGVDLGGTKIEGVVLALPSPLVDSESLSGANSGNEPSILARRRVPTEASLGYRHILTRVAGLVADLEKETGIARASTIGIGTPGAMRPDGTMKNCNTVCLNSSRLRDDLASELGAHVSLANDADCFALAEARLGAGRGYHSVFGVILGTGVGAGIVIGGQLLRGPNGLAGEWGHITLVPDGNQCYCGRRGCVETYLSGPAVELGHYDRTGQRLRLADIAAKAECTQPSSDAASQCQETIDRMCDDFGKALANVVNVLDPDVIVLGGGAGQVSQLRTQGRDRLAENVFGPDFATPLAAPRFGDSAGVFGAALLTQKD